ncbi:response regulator transcription factor [Thalassobaculum sp.]|uniref:response regulator transcription factor n=1 Tax=Thalassobaculum sp. TaxID=2022740 RepID=UPI0032EF4FA2
MRILLVEDEPDLGAAVREHLAADGHAVDWVMRVDDADASLRAVDYGLVLLDLHLPDGRGLDLLKAIRAAANASPVIIVTARDQISDRIAGLNAGADDYLVKPFDLDELRARVAAVSRRYAGNPNPTLWLGELEIDKASRRIRRGDETIELTRREWAVLDLLMQRPGAVVSKGRLEEALYDFEAEVESNTVEVHVSRLRKKLGRDTIRTLRGVGYRVDPS